MSNADGLARPPIDAEELAAFIDGRLEGERRRRVIEQLAEDEEACELYSAVIEVREALAAGSADGAVPHLPGGVGVRSAVPIAPADRDSTDRARRPWPQKRFGWWRTDRSGIGWLPAAAGIAAAAAVAVLATWWALRPTGSREFLAAFEDGTVTLGVAREAPETLEPIYRGEDEEQAATFKLGARAFDLALAVDAGDLESAQRWLGEMSRLLREVPWGLDLPEQYRELAGRLAGGESLQSLRRDVAKTEAALEPLLDGEPEQLPAPPPLFAFGRWVEAVRTAAAHGDRNFLASAAALRPLPKFLASSPSDEVASRLDRIGSALGPAAASADLAAVARDARAILAHCADGKPCLGEPDP